MAPPYVIHTLTHHFVWRKCVATFQDSMNYRDMRDFLTETGINLYRERFPRQRLRYDSAWCGIKVLEPRTFRGVHWLQRAVAMHSPELTAAWYAACAVTVTPAIYKEAEHEVDIILEDYPLPEVQMTFIILPLENWLFKRGLLSSNWIRAIALKAPNARHGKRYVPKWLRAYIYKNRLWQNDVALYGPAWRLTARY